MQPQFPQVLICNRVSVFQDLVFLAVDLAGLVGLVDLVDLVGFSSRFEASDLAGAAHNGAKGCKMDLALLLKAPKGLLKSPDEVSELMLAGLEAWEQNHCHLGRLGHLGLLHCLVGFWVEKESL